MTEFLLAKSDRQGLLDDELATELTGSILPLCVCQHERLTRKASNCFIALWER